MAYSKEKKTEIINEICELIASGLSLRKALKEAKNKIGVETFYVIIDEDKEKAKQYARAIEMRTEVKFDSIEQDYLEKPQRDPETGKIDSAWVQLQRLKIDAKKWELSKLNPRKYGDKIDITSDNEKIGAMPLVVNVYNTAPPLSTSEDEVDV